MIKKAIIPAAGLGTRILPATKAQPKAMLPIVDKPAIQYIVEEAALSGIEDIIIVTDKGKKAIEDHFDYSYELEQALEQKNMHDQVKEIRHLANLVNIYYVRQKELKGLGHAVLCAKSFIGKEAFAVLLADDVMSKECCCLKQLIEAYQYCNSSVVAVQSVPQNEVSKYGIIKPRGSNLESELVQIEHLLEKPSIADAPSTFAVIGRYVLRQEIFEVLETTPLGKGNELQLTDAINELNKKQAVYAYNYKGTRYDIGSRIGFVKANIDYALQREDIRDELIPFLQQQEKLNLLQQWKRERD